MLFVDELYYNKGSNGWYRKGTEKFEFEKPERDGDSIVFRQKFPGMIPNVKKQATLVLTADDIEQLKKLICIT